MRTVGILGGMGPEATVLLMQKVIRAVPAADDADHVHLIVDQNPQVPSRIAFFLEGKGENPGPVLAEMARRLETAGAEALGMACNTAHHYAPEIRAAVTVPFLDMVELSAAEALNATGPDARVGILASPAVRLTGLYDRALEKVGAEAVYPPDQDALLAAIREIKTSGGSPRARALLRDASAALLDRGTTVQLIACTEFSIISDSLAEGAEGIDTLDVLSEAIRRFATEAQ